MWNSMYAGGIGSTSVPQNFMQVPGGYMVPPGPVPRAVSTGHSLQPGQFQGAHAQMPPRHFISAPIQQAGVQQTGSPRHAPGATHRCTANWLRGGGKTPDEGRLYISDTKIEWFGVKSQKKLVFPGKDVKTVLVHAAKSRVRLSLILQKELYSFEFQLRSAKKKTSEDLPKIQKWWQKQQKEIVPLRQGSSDAWSSVVEKHERRSQVLGADSRLMQAHRLLVSKQTLTDDEFWREDSSCPGVRPREILRRDGQSTANEWETPSLASAFLADVKPKIEGGKLKFELGPPTIAQIFAEEPETKELFDPQARKDKSDVEIWELYFKRKYTNIDDSQHVERRRTAQARVSAQRLRRRRRLKRIASVHSRLNLHASAFDSNSRDLRWTLACSTVDMGGGGVSGNTHMLMHSLGSFSQHLMERLMAQGKLCAMDRRRINRFNTICHKINHHSETVILPSYSTRASTSSPPEGAALQGSGAKRMCAWRPIADAGGPRLQTVSLHIKQTGARHSGIRPLGSDVTAVKQESSQGSRKKQRRQPPEHVHQLVDRVFVGFVKAEALFGVEEYERKKAEEAKVESAVKVQLLQWTVVVQELLRQLNLQGGVTSALCVGEKDLYRRMRSRLVQIKAKVKLRKQEHRHSLLYQYLDQQISALESRLSGTEA